LPLLVAASRCRFSLPLLVAVWQSKNPSCYDIARSECIAVFEEPGCRGIEGIEGRLFTVQRGTEAEGWNSVLLLLAFSLHSPLHLQKMKLKLSIKSIISLIDIINYLLYFLLLYFNFFFVFSIMIN